MATASGDSVAAANDPKIDGLLQGSQWDFGAGPHILTYSFNLSGVAGSGGWSSAQQAGVRAAFAAWSAVANIQFKQVQSGTYFYQSTADIALSVTGTLQQQQGFWGEGLFPDASYGDQYKNYFLDTYAPGKTGLSYANPQGDIFIDNQALPGDLNPFNYFNPGGVALSQMLHEIGHVLGLKHPFDDGDNSKPTFSQLGLGNLDTTYNTVMSYTPDSQPSGQNWIDWGNPSTPMPLDILAIQYLYGVNRTTHTGNDTYYFRDNGVVQTIWDAGGYDTVDASGLPVQSMNGYNTIDLRPGQISRYIENWTGTGGEQSVSAIAMSYTPTETQDGAVAPIDNLIERAIGSAATDYIYGNDANNALLGGGGNDILQDTIGNDLLDGGVGADQMTGGAGDDSYVIDNIGDTISENANEGNDSVKTSIILGGAIANVENYTYTGASNWNFTATDADNVIISGGGKDWISSGLGNDTLNGGAGADTLIGGQGDDYYFIDNIADQVTEYAGEGNDTVKSSVILTKLIDNVENYLYTGVANWIFTGTDGDNLLAGGGGQDKLTGGNGNDVLDGGGNIDILTGGQGDDTYVVDNAGDKVIEASGEGTDLVKSSVTLNLGAGNFIGQEIEQATLTGAGALNLTGNALDNILTGNAGANIIDGGIGKDAMSGGLGNDTYIIDDAGDTITEDINAGIDTVKSSLLIGATIANVENYTYTGGSDWNFAGTDVVNVLTAGAGNDRLDGGAGADTLAGGLGNDTYVIDNAGDKVIEAANQGTDTIESSVSINLGAGVFLNQAIENVTLTGTAAIDATGNALVNALTGNDAANSLNGGAGADILTGGKGDDTYVMDNIGDQVIEDADAGNDTVRSSVILTKLIDNIENYTYTGALGWSFTGDADDNALIGGSGADKLSGGDGNDLLDGGTNADILTGGQGDDTYVVDNIGDKVIEAIGEGIDLVKTSITLNLAAGNFLGQEIEKATLIGAAAVNLTGNALDNTLTGNAAANVIDGGIGADKMAGGLGNDIYVIDDAGDTVTEDANAGTDTVKTSVAIADAIDNVENYIFTGVGGWSFTGNALNNAITGGAGNDKLDGGAGADTLVGGLGDDTYIVDNAKDTVIEGINAGIDTVILAGSLSSYVLGANLENLDASKMPVQANLTLTGNTAGNVITGGSGNDALNGGAGADMLTGGAGDDTYIVDNISDKVIEKAGEGNDTIRSSILLASLIANVENYTYIGALAWTFTGDDGDNAITGGNGADKLSGGLGNDVLGGGAGGDKLVGGQGDDTYVIDNAGDVVVEAAGEGTDLIESCVSINLVAGAFVGQEIENVTLTGVTAINVTGNELRNELTGNAGANTLSGGIGDDILDGGAGADTLIGGVGDDTYVIDNASDKVVELAGQGNDTIISTVNIDLSSGAFSNQEIENVTLDGAASLNAIGNGLANVIKGNAGSNLLNGGIGADTLIGGAGADTYIVDNANDVVVEGLDGGSDTIKTTLTTSYAVANVEAYIFAGSGIWHFIGDSAASTITGGAGDDQLDGGTGGDIMAGGLGNDTYYIDNIGDRITELAGQGKDTVVGSVTIDLTAAGLANQDIEAVTLVGSDDLNATGNALNNTITGNAGDNVLDGGAGSDILIGGDGNDTYIINDYNDTIVEGVGGGTDLVITSISFGLSNYGTAFGQEVENVTAVAGTAALTLGGNSLDNVLTGNAGNNVLNGFTGADRMIGGAGNDTYYIYDIGDIAIEAAGGGYDAVYSYINLDLTAGAWAAQEIEYVRLEDDSVFDAFNITGNDLDNVLVGNNEANTLSGGGGDDTLTGEAGADVMIGGQGNDTYYVDDNNDAIIESAGEGTDTVIMYSLAYHAVTNVENYTYKGSANWIFTGNDEDNVITGSIGNDMLDGDLGADTMIGGLGDDTYHVDNAGDVIVEAISGAGLPYGGRDTVIASVDYTLGTGTEVLELSGSGNINGTGNLWSNTIYGNAGNNILNGGGALDLVYGEGGDDILIGGTGDILDGGNGNDTVDYEYVSVGITANLATGWGANDSYSNIENITGSHFNDQITGNIGNNVLDGNGGYDTLTGGGGYDIYKFQKPGNMIINNAVSGGTQASGELDFGSGITAQNLWFMQSGQNLNVYFVGMGSLNSQWVAINGWFGANASAQLTEIVLADGSKIDSGLSQLISTMASYSAAHPITVTDPTLVMPTDATLQSAIAAAWHS